MFHYLYIFLQLQQKTTTSNINIPPASAVVAGEGSLLQYGQAMAAETFSGGGGSRDGSAPAAQAKAQPRSMSERSKLLRIPKPEPGLRCPRCDSTSTKFSYFNNYSLAQPRYFCRNCHRYWTRGSALRDIPVGAPYRRRRAKGNKPSAAATAASASSAALAMTSSCTTNVVVARAPTPQQTTASSSESPVLPQLYNGLASMDTPNVGSNFSWPGAANLLVMDSAGGRAVSESKMKQQWGTRKLPQSSQMHKLPVFSHAIDQQQGPAVAVPVTMATPPSMFHPLWSGGDGGIYSGGEGQFHMITNRDEECPIWAMQADVNGYTTSYDPIPVIQQVINLYSVAKNLNRKKPSQSAFKFQDVTPSIPNQTYITVLEDQLYTK